MLRACDTCLIELPLTAEHFRPSAKSRGGFFNHCRPCERAHNRAKDAKRPQYEPIKRKFCPGCQETLPGSSFSIARKDVTGLQARCKPCTRAKARELIYGLKPEVYERMLAEQDGKCACCGDKTRLVVDHCHQTGRVRSLLCNSCNSAEGYVRTVERAWMLIRYMQARC